MRLPLFERFPESGEAAPRVELASLPTPIEAVRVDIGANGLLVKRDDLTSPVYGGNKVRKLEFLLGRAVSEGARAVLTFGAYGSNHALATAVHARGLGLEPHVILSPQQPGPYAARTLRAHAGIGTAIHLVEGWDGQREAVRVRKMLRERDGVDPYVIPMGGTDRFGNVGYVNAAIELAEQVDADVVYLAGGTLGTAVGLALGFAAADRTTRVVAVRVTPAEVANVAFAAELARDTGELLAAADPSFPRIPLSELAFELRDDWFEPGYGIPTTESFDAVEAARRAGIGLETTYTGKAFAAMLADGAAGKLAGKSVVFLDSYNSAPMPPAGPDELLPTPLQEYVRECDRLFGRADSTVHEGDAR